MQAASAGATPVLSSELLHHDTRHWWLLALLALTGFWRLLATAGSCLRPSTPRWRSSPAPSSQRQVLPGTSLWTGWRAQLDPKTCSNPALTCTLGGWRLAQLLCCARKALTVGQALGPASLPPRHCTATAMLRCACCAAGQQRLGAGAGPCGHADPTPHCRAVPRLAAGPLRPGCALNIFK